MGIFTSSYVYFGYCLGPDVGAGAYARLKACDAYLSNEAYQGCVSDFGGKAVLHAPGSLVCLSQVDSIIRDSWRGTSVLLNTLIQAMRQPRQEFPTQQPARMAESDIERCFFVPDANRETVVEVLRLAIGDNALAPAWYFLEVTSDTYGENHPPRLRALPVLMEA